MRPAPSKKGSLEVICGSMFSGKSEELIYRLKRAQLAQQRVLALKHSLDTRSCLEYVISHNGNKIQAIAVEKPQHILELCSDQINVVGIDEVQFFSQDIIHVICTLIEQGKRVLVAGLDLDFTGKPFGSLPFLMAIADYVTKLKAICVSCGKEAHVSQRLVNGKPAKIDDPQIVVGAQETYQARCRDCHIINYSSQN